MSNAFASGVFLLRNTEKVQNGEIGRAPAVVAQTGSLANKTKTLIEEINKFDAKVANTADTAVDVYKSSAKAASFGSKALNLAGELVDPLLVVAAGVRVLSADDKEAALYNEAGGMTGMFAVERLMKKSGVKDFIKANSDEAVELGIKKLSKYIKPLQNVSEKSKNKFVKAATFIITGTVFVLGSILGYDTGKKIGQNALESKREKEATSKIAQNSNQIIEADESPQNSTLSIES